MATFYCEVNPKGDVARVTIGFKGEEAPVDVVLSKSDALKFASNDLPSLLKMAGVHPGEVQDVVSRFVHKLAPSEAP